MNHFKILLFMTAIFLMPHGFAKMQTEGSTRTQPIIGYAPSIHSIGVKLNPQTNTLFDKDNHPVLTVNSQLYVPSINCVTHNSNPDELKSIHHFNFFDRDEDACIHHNNGLLEWYILDPLGKPWSRVASWEDLNAIPITASAFPDSLLPPGTIPESAHTTSLKIPSAAAGKRIGLIYQPKSKTGSPHEGQPIKVWDLDYFFGQIPYSYAGTPTEPNEGVKLTKINSPSAGGTVYNITPPRVENTFLHGVFVASQSIELKYDFIANTKGAYQDVSRFWWGKRGSTKSSANFQNQNYSTSRFSPVLTQTDAGQVYEVTILPIKQEAGFYSVGQAVTILSSDNQNQLAKLPSINKLSFTQDIRINQTLAATYEFDNDGFKQVQDRSKYAWAYRDILYNLRPLASGTITQSGVVPPTPILDVEVSGRTLQLTMTPIDNFARQGNPVRISETAESVEKVSISPKVLTFHITQPESIQLTATAYYSKGTILDVTNSGMWSTSDLAIVVNTDGLVSIAPEQIEDLVGTIKFTFRERSDTAEVTVHSALDLTLTPIQNNAIANQESNSLLATVTNANGEPIENARINLSSFDPSIQILPNSGTTNSKGELIVSVTKSNTTGGTFDILATMLSGHSARTKVNFLTLKDIHSILAPGNYRFYPNQAFPTTGFDNATFNVIASNSLNNNTLTWSSNNSSAISIDANGSVTLKEQSLNKPIEIIAKNNEYAYRYQFTVRNWFLPPKYITFDAGANYCAAMNARVPTRSQLSLGKGKRDIGSLWAEWQKPTDWTQSVNSHYWSKTESAFRHVYVIDIITGENTEIKGNDGAYKEHVTCVKE